MRSIVVSLIATMLCAVTTEAVEIGELRRVRESITTLDLKVHAETLADDSFEGREAGTRGGRAAAGYLAKQLQDRGLRGAGDEGGYFQYFNNCRNVLAVLPGRDPELRKQVVLVSGHYDHVGYGNGKTSLGPIGYIHNGADDNASGVSGVLEIVDAVVLLSEPPRRSILFAFWDGEEQGLWGSQHWVGHPTVPMNQVVAMINVDMIGRLRNDRVEVFGVRSAPGFRELISRQNRGTGLLCDFNWEMKSNSDHYTFFERNVPTIMFHTGLHSDYHRPSDDVEKLNTEGMEKIVRLMFDTIYELAERVDRVPFRQASKSETPSDSNRLEQPLPPLPLRLGIVWDGNDNDQSGFLITRVTAGSAADRAGLRIGDRLVQFGGVRLANDDELRRMVSTSESPVEAVVKRNGVREPVRVTIELEGKPTRIGISWRDDEGEPNSCLVVRVVAGSPADLGGVRLRDRVLEVNGLRIESSDHFRELLTSEATPLELLVERSGQLQLLQVKAAPN